MSDHYILVNGEPQRELDVIRWARWMENNRDQRTLARTEIAPGVQVSTVFLGLDHGWGEGAPILWETMVFGGPLGEEQERYTSREEALAGHARYVELARTAKEPEPEPLAWTHDPRALYAETYHAHHDGAHLTVYRPLRDRVWFATAEAVREVGDRERQAEVRGTVAQETRAEAERLAVELGAEVRGMMERGMG